MGVSLLNFIASLVLQASLSQLWSMLNSLQLIVFMPMLRNLKFPGNAMMLNEVIISVATFDLIPTDLLDEQLYYFPEEDPYSLNFAQVGYEFTLFVNNVGFILYVVWSHFFMVFVWLCLSCVKSIRQRLGKYLFWNAFIRLTMESFQDLLLLGALNLQEADWDSPFPAVRYSNYLAAVFVGLACFTPSLFLSCVLYKRTDWSKPQFRNRYGSVLEGTSFQVEEKRKWTLIIYPIVFFARRASFVVTVLAMKDILWA